MAAKLRHNSRVHLIAPLTLFDPLLSGAALVVEGDDSLGRTFRGYSLANQMRQCRVRGDEGQFARRRLSEPRRLQTFPLSPRNGEGRPTAVVRSPHDIDTPWTVSRRQPTYGSGLSVRIRSPRTRRSFEKTAGSARRTTQTVGGLESRYVAAADRRGGANVESVRDALVGTNDRLHRLRTARAGTLGLEPPAGLEPL